MEGCEARTVEVQLRVRGGGGGGKVVLDGDHQIVHLLRVQPGVALLHHLHSHHTPRTSIP